MSIFLKAAVYGFNVIGLEGEGDGNTFLERGGAGLAHEMKDMEQGRRHGRPAVYIYKERR
jgi:hypothetical protein